MSLGYQPNHTAFSGFCFQLVCFFPYFLSLTLFFFIIFSKTNYSLLLLQQFFCHLARAFSAPIFITFLMYSSSDESSLIFSRNGFSKSNNIFSKLFFQIAITDCAIVVLIIKIITVSGLKQLFK